jgi:hypothetical protein
MKSALNLLFALLLLRPAPGARGAAARQSASPGPPQMQEVPTSQSSPDFQNPPAAQNVPPSQNPSSDYQQTPSLEQQQAAIQDRVVPLRDEPHHRLVLRNDLINVYTVAVPPYDATLMHRHDLPYLAINLGPGDLVNIVQGKAQAHLTLQDGQVTYSSGGFAHVVRTDSGAAFRNVTVELAKPQGTARNLCKEIVPGPLTCPEQAEAARQAATEVADAQRKTSAAKVRRGAPRESTTTAKKAPAEADDDVAYFETDEIRVDVITVSNGRDYAEEAPRQDALLIAMTNSNLNAHLGAKAISFLHDGDILWLPAGESRRVVDFLGTRSNFLLVSFKDRAAATTP